MIKNKTFPDLDEQINYLQAYAELLKAQQNMIEQQLKFLKAGKAIQDNVLGFQNMFMDLGFWTKLNPTMNQKIKEQEKEDK